MAQVSRADMPAMLVKITGRVDFVRAGEVNGRKSVLTLIKAPAADPYSAPATVEVRSVDRLGAVGEEVTVFANLSGYRQTGTRKDGEPFTRAQNVLQAFAA